MLIAALVVSGVVVVAARAFGWQTGPLYYLVALTPYFGAALALAGLVAALMKARILAVVSFLLAAVVAFWWYPAFFPTKPPTDAGLTVMTANLQYGQADPGPLIEAVRANDVDVLSVQELTGEAVIALQRAGLGRSLPYQYLRPAQAGSAAGTGLWSRFPLTSRDAVKRVFVNLSATITTPSGPVTVFAVHPIPASPTDGELGVRNFTAIRRFLESQPGPAIAAGDFNATRDNVPLRTLAGDGWADSATSAGAGFVRTWPTQGYPIGPIVAIDHILTRQVPQANKVVVVDLPGSDHRGVIARISL